MVVDPVLSEGFYWGAGLVLRQAWAGQVGHAPWRTITVHPSFLVHLQLSANSAFKLHRCSGAPQERFSCIVVPLPFLQAAFSLSY